MMAEPTVMHWVVSKAARWAAHLADKTAASTAAYSAGLSVGEKAEMSADLKADKMAVATVEHWVVMRAACSADCLVVSKAALRAGC